jgi:hypothetical protein
VDAERRVALLAAVLGGLLWVAVSSGSSFSGVRVRRLWRGDTGGSGRKKKAGVESTLPPQRYLYGPHGERPLQIY